ncbi:EAL domain-containing protein [Pseudohalocynthiibacter aestuariivivens]|jgi:EAL domain-containing protein (putative c-di-GMP-specific phosphodiesterase class I)|uniref:EAL domain-containing protein n=1 Tax=Pseudohalocynthiibacter aestuariivivens TaxID=1591409 RepID=A0ABV5JJ81_9RHOB|nr:MULTISPECIES: EAL domain-containing protein [Pseudohalocynthiibacter]MBS9717478.1 EAL domain-containing protein [Pseudohalocynthiibacter aestuariivivens]MCK0102187.1 EAL domain-containing protein [Pseudohalocynthiibacter sp. F2068]
MLSDLSTLGVEIADSISSPLSVAIESRDRDTLKMVRDALNRKQVMLAFQPIVQARNPNQIAFYEGLIRIMDGNGRIIPARDFIDVIENNEMGRIIDCLALELGLNTLANDAGLRLSINMSARSIGYQRWMQTLNHGLALEPTIGERLILEITESSAMLMPELVTSFMADLQKKGIAFALDDFGAGYTAFRYLKDFYFDVIKIDGQFVRGISKEADNQVLTRALMSIAQHFDMFTVAEAVENVEDAIFLTEMGIDCLQGYYFGAPFVKRPSGPELKRA